MGVKGWRSGGSWLVEVMWGIFFFFGRGGGGGSGGCGWGSCVQMAGVGSGLRAAIDIP